MRLATIVLDGRPRVAVIDERDRVHPLDPSVTMRDVAAGVVRVPPPSGDGLLLADVRLGPAVPDPGAIYTIGLNYNGPGAAPCPDRPLVYGKAPSSVGAHGATLAWDRSVTDDVDAEIELGIVIGRPAFHVVPGDALDHVFGYTCINDISARDEALDGDQWLLGKSMPGFCPVGPWIVTADAFDPRDVRLGCTINGEPIQDGRTSQIRSGIDEIVAYLSRHLELRPGDLIASGTPVRLATPPGPGRRLRAGDTVTVWVEGIGELTTRIG